MKHDERQPLLPRQTEEPNRCALCEREVKHITRHHLIPRSEGGRDVIDLCIPCHETLHSFFSNQTLVNELDTLEALQRQPDITPYLKWIRTQPDRVVRVNTRRDKR
jgi:hypothetical protein